jgi:uncharacterized repeat protein (TIGR01451 family)
LTFTVGEPGRHCHTVEVTADSTLPATAEGCVTAKGVAAEIEGTTSIKLAKTGPEKMKVGERALFKIEVTNTGDEPIMGLQVTESWRGGLKPIDATAGNVSTGPGEITWNYRQPLQPGATVPFEVRYEALSPQEENCSRSTASAGDDTATDEQCVEITGEAEAPAADSLEVVISDADPVPVGTQFRYRIRVRNSGTTPQTNVALTVEVPESINIASIQAPVEIQNVKPPLLRFPAVKLLEPGKLVVYELHVTATQAGRMAIRAEASSNSVTNPIGSEESTDVFDPARSSK